MLLALRDEIFPAAERTAVRAQLDAAGWELRGLADRHHLEVGRAAAAAALFDRLRDIAAEAARSAALPTVAAFEWLRLRHGDYQLFKSDAHARPAGAPREVIADFSESATGEAELFYGNGTTTAAIVPQRPGSVAVVARPPGLYRYQRYLSLRVGAALVYRLRLTLI